MSHMFNNLELNSLIYMSPSHNLVSKKQKKMLLSCCVPLLLNAILNAILKSI